MSELINESSGARNPHAGICEGTAGATRGSTLTPGRKMKNLKKIESCLFSNETELPDETPIYKYLSIEAFLFLIEFNYLTFSRISKWPDHYEGARFEFFKEMKVKHKFSKKNKNDFFGSCWTLQAEESCLYEDPKDYQNAIDELQKNGSASMWDSFCKNGGVRIKTTLGKMNTLLEANLNRISIFRGRVFYEPEKSWGKTLCSSDLISKLFMKRVSFRHEAEYRYILVPNGKIKKPNIIVPIKDLFDFFDEILICPATASSKWITRTLYNIAVGISIRPGYSGTNYKNGKQFCRISQLYGLISESIGYYDMG